MEASEILKASERSAIENEMGEQIVSHVVGKSGNKKKGFRSWGAVGLITLMLLVVAILFSSGNLIPAAISARLIEETDVQYADAVESKILVFQQALENGDLPANTIKRLEAQGVQVNGSSLEYKDKNISASEFVDEVHSNIGLYNAFTAATYDRAAYYYDESAEKVFKKIGTSRNNYTKSSDFDEVMTKVVGKGSNVDVGNVGLVKKVDENGKEYEDYEVIGDKATSSEAEEFVRKVAENNLSEDGFKATMEATNAINAADTISKEQKSSVFYMALMENISKMKAGQGSEAKINETMNYLFKEQDSEVVDTSTGEVITVRGSMLESPSLYAVLSGSKIDGEKVKNYASDRILKTVESATSSGAISSEVRDGTVTSSNTKIRGTIGRYIFEGLESGDYDSMAAVVPTINSSLVENDFDGIGGIYGGELLVEGAVNVGKMLAKSSGGTAGDSEAAEDYARLNSTVLAMDAEVDRMNRSPFDVTSRNTFLGSIVYNLGVGMSSSKVGSLLHNVGSTIGSIMGGVFSKITPSTKADNESDKYLGNFGNYCETIDSIGAVGSVGFSEIATFDTSTLNNPFHNDEFMAFVEENTEFEDGKRTIKNDSILANFIKYNNERITPIGVMDGGILEAISGDSSSIPFVSNLVSMIKTWLFSSDEDKAIATGKVFVNSSSNPEWETYKYAQRYVSLARATDALRQYDGDETAYINLKYFEGGENPVIAFLDEYYSEIATK